MKEGRFFTKQNPKPTCICSWIFSLGGGRAQSASLLRKLYVHVHVHGHVRCCGQLLLPYKAQDSSTRNPADQVELTFMAKTPMISGVPQLPMNRSKLMPT